MEKDSWLYDRVQCQSEEPTTEEIIAESIVQLQDEMDIEIVKRQLDQEEE